MQFVVALLMIHGNQNCLGTLGIRRIKQQRAQLFIYLLSRHLYWLLSKTIICKHRKLSRKVLITSCMNRKQFNVIVIANVQGHLSRSIINRLSKESGMKPCVMASCKLCYSHTILKILAYCSQDGK